MQFRVFEAVFLRIRQDAVQFPPGGGQRRLQQALQEGLYGTGILRHAVLGAVGGPVRIAQESGDADAQVRDLPDDREVVVVTPDGPGVVSQVQFPLECAVAAVFQERGITGMGQVEGPAALAFLLRRFGGGLLYEVGEVRDARLVRDVEGEGVGRGKHMLAILQAEEREFLH